MRNNIAFLLFVLFVHLLILPGRLSAASGAEPPVTILTCPLDPPASISVTNLTPTSANFTWSPVPGAVDYNVRLVETATNIPVTVIYGGSTTVSAFTTSMQANTGYTFSVRASSCPGGEYGAWNSVDFTTPQIIIGEIVYGYEDEALYFVTPESSINDVYETCLPKFREDDGSFDQENDMLRVRLDWHLGEANRFVVVGLRGILPNKVKVDIVYYGPGTNSGNTELYYFAPHSVKLRYRISPGNYLPLSKFHAVAGMGNMVGARIDPENIIADLRITPPQLLGSCIVDDRDKAGAAGLEVLPNAAAFPNPFTDLLTIPLNPVQPDGQAQLTLTNAYGQTVWSWQPDPEQAAAGLEIGLKTTDLPPGVYILSIRTAAGRQTQTLFKH